MRSRNGQIAPKMAMRARRRGTVLVIVLGALALLSLVLFVYLTVGQADRRTGAVTVRNDEIEQTAQATADYIADVISRDVLDTFYNGSDPQGTGRTQPITLRETFDFPWTDSAMRSQTGSPYLRFRPSGSVPVAPGGAAETRVPSDPFLASSEPARLIQPPAGTLVSEPVRRDWSVISNLAPSGNPVNIWNLRGNIGAEPGFGTDSRGRDRMSENLSLLDDAGAPTLTLDYGGAANKNIPAHWTTRQRGAAKPARDVRNRPGDSNYLFYQWADADGDGIFDSRWFMLEDVTDQANPVSLLPQKGRFRWVIAARVVDASGRLNVNTATDFRGAPSANVPAGSSPAEADLRRLLTLEPMHRDWAPTGIGYESLEFYDTGYSAYTRSVAQSIGGLAFQSIRLAIAESAVPPAGTTLPPDTALTALERKLYYGTIGSQADGASFAGIGATRRFELGGLFGQADGLELWLRDGVNNPAETSRLEAAAGGRLTAEPTLGVLRDNRTLRDELATIDDDEFGGQGNGQLDDDAMIRLAFDARRRITPISGARPIRTTSRTVLNNQLSAAEVRVDAVAALQDATATTPTVRTYTSLFRDGYLESLAPNAWRRDAWDPTANPTAQSLAPLHYGSSLLPPGGGATPAPAGPLFATIAAAHMTLNMADLYDRDQRPSAATLLLRESDRAAVASDVAAFPWWSQPAESGKLDAGASRLAQSGQPVPAPAMNIFGIEAQPFITQAATVSLYTDARVAAGGDQEYIDPSSFDPPVIIATPITINGWVSSSNPDFIAQFFAVQVTNPFSEPVKLSAYDPASATVGAAGSPVTGGLTEFYIQWGGYFFNLSEFDSGLASQASVVLEPGQTRTFYATNPSPAEIISRLQAADPAVDVAALDRFVQNQFGIDAGTGAWLPPILMTRVDPATGTPELSFVDLLGGTTEEKQTVHLWRSMPGPAASPRADDMLADRMRDDPGVVAGGAPPTLGRKLAEFAGSGGSRPPGILVAGTISGPETDVTRDNRGFSITVFGTVRRPDDPGAPTVPLGAIPAWCIESKWTASGFYNNREEDNIGGLSSLQRSDFFPATPPQIGAETLATLMDTLAPVGGEPPPPIASAGVRPDVLAFNIRNRPENKSGNTMPGNRSTPSRSYTSLYPEIPLANDEFERTLPTTPARTVSVLRVTDLLLPLAVGPAQSPVVSGAFADPDTVAPGWVTLSEALAAALNYSNPSDTADPFLYLIRAGASNPSGNVFPKLDRGNLVLDDFAPYEDRDQDGQFGVNSADARRWPGIPLALNILNVFGVQEPQFGTLTRPTTGLVNLNTAPLPVLRALPMLTPTGEAGAWWGSGSGAMPQPINDAAAAIERYREKRWTEVPGSGLDYQDIDTTTLDRRTIPDTPGEWNGRAFESGIPGVREAPGLASHGEILAVVGANDGAGAASPWSIRHAATNGGNSGRVGVTSALHRPGGTGTPTINGISDDFAEQLLVASALGSTASVRSDVFIVWFVLQGYQESDVTDLGPDDPLRPSVSKRYLMVVDRSNVTRLGEKPRVLVFAELPN